MSRKWEEVESHVAEGVEQGRVENWGISQSTAVTKKSLACILYYIL